MTNSQVSQSAEIEDPRLAYNETKFNVSLIDEMKDFSEPNTNSITNNDHNTLSA